jgi:hypothetical protein
MKSKITLLASLILLSAYAFAQTNGGKAFFMDYAQFQSDNTTRYIKCAHNAALNTGDELTLEAWVKIHDSGWNQKVVGMLNSSFNSGYLLAIDQGKVYPEVWNPSNQNDLAGFIPPVPSPGYWQHIALTFKKGDSLRSFLNGVQVGAIPVPNGALASNSEDLTIGISPWGESFQFFGHIDEVRVWNVAKTEQEMQSQMHIELTGNETGLVAYYTFNTSTHSAIEDKTANAIDGSITRGQASNIANSTCIVASNTMNTMNDIYAIWNALGFTDPRYVTTATGLSMKASGMDEDDHGIFGHNDGNGTTTADLPTNASANFERADRVFYIEQDGNLKADLIIKLDDIAGTGAELDDTKTAAHYTLLYRSGTTGAFTARSSASSMNGKTLIFNNDQLQNGYYTIGVGDSPIVGPSAINGADLSKQVSVFPNPNSGLFTVQFENLQYDAKIQVYNALGALVYEYDALATEFTKDIDLSHVGSGVYYIKVSSNQMSMVEKIIVN